MSDRGIQIALDLAEITMNLASAKIDSLKAELEGKETRIVSQSRVINEQAERIEDLETFQGYNKGYLDGKRDTTPPFKMSEWYKPLTPKE